MLGSSQTARPASPVARGTLAALALACLPAAALGAQVGAIGPGALAGATALTFDDGPGGTVANTRYAAQGVTFTRDDAGPVTLYDWAALGRTTTSPRNVLATTGVPYTTHLNVLFSSPQRALGAYFGNDQSAGFETMRLSVFDAGGLVGSVDVAANGNISVDQFIGLRSTTPFSRARFDVVQSLPTFAVIVDDLAFSARVSSVPEPGTWSLVGAGLLALAGLATQRQRCV